MSCTKPKGALYVFPRLDPEVYPIKDDERMALDLLTGAVQAYIFSVLGMVFIGAAISDTHNQVNIKKGEVS